MSVRAVTIDLEGICGPAESDGSLFVTPDTWQSEVADWMKRQFRGNTRLYRVSQLDDKGHLLRLIVPQPVQAQVMALMPDHLPHLYRATAKLQDGSAVVYGPHAKEYIQQVHLGEATTVNLCSGFSIDDTLFEG